MTTEGQTVREKIKLAVIEGIEEQGIQSLTVREIARRAHVNVAAINYHFGSKENLIEIALHQTLDEAFINMIDEELTGDGSQPLELLQKFFLALFTGLRQFPGLTRAHLYAPLMQNDYRGVFSSRFWRFLNDLHKKCQELFPEKSDHELQLAIMEILSAIIFPGLLSDLFSDYTEIDFDDPNQRSEYINHLVLRHFKTVQENDQKGQ